MVLQKLQPGDQHRRTTFCTELPALMEEDGFIKRLIFSDECTFHLYGKVTRHDVRIWGAENPKSVVEVVRDSPRMNVFGEVLHLRFTACFSFRSRLSNGYSAPGYAY